MPMSGHCILFRCAAFPEVINFNQFWFSWLCVAMLRAAALDDDDDDTEADVCVCVVCAVVLPSFNILTCVMFMCNSMRSYYRPIQTNEKCNLYVLKEIERHTKRQDGQEEEKVKHITVASLALKNGIYFSVYTHTQHENRTTRFSIVTQRVHILE